jgi:hypothetical protein
MIHGLLILNSSYSGARDLFWPLDPYATKGYDVYRSFDDREHWVKLNAPGPVPGNVYRDQTNLEQIEYTVQAADWIDNGETGMRIFKLPEMPYSSVIQGHPRVAASPEEVAVAVTDISGVTTILRPAQVDGISRLVYLRVDRSLTTGGAVSNTPVVDFRTAASFVAIYNRLSNFVDIQTNMVRTFYTVVPVGDRGPEHLPGAFGTEVVNQMEVDRMDYIQREMVRRNAWIFEQRAEPAYLLLKRRCGERCGCMDNDTGVPLTRCPSCFETGIILGYYGPYDFPYIDPDSGSIRTIDEGGIKVERQSRSYLGPSPVVQDGDLIMRRNGERLLISGVSYTMPRGVLLQQEFNCELLNPGDTRYLVPIFTPAKPIIYNPAFQKDMANGAGGAEPVFETGQAPGHPWENKLAQVGRTVVFGNIQS